MAHQTILLTALMITTLLGAHTSLLSQRAVAQTVPTIETEGGVWTSPTVSVVIVPSNGDAWYRQSYADDAAYAVQRWAQSIIVFTDIHGYSYLRQITFQIYAYGANTTVPEVQIVFVRSFPSTGTQALGKTETIRNSMNNHFVALATVTLAAQDPSMLRNLTDNDMVNIATHEFGHALGIGHTNTLTTDDNFLELMSTTYNLLVGNANNPLEAPSTLNLYALATIYNYLATSPTLTGPGKDATPLTLPANIPYTATYPYPEQVEALKTGLTQANQRIIILALLTAALLAATITFAILLTRRKPPPAQFPAPYQQEPSPATAQYLKEQGQPDRPLED